MALRDVYKITGIVDNPVPPFDIAYLIMAIHICFTLYIQNTQKIQSKNKYLCAIRLWKVLDLDAMTMYDTCVQCTH